MGGAGYFSYIVSYLVSGPTALTDPRPSPSLSPCYVGDKVISPLKIARRIVLFIHLWHHE